MIYTCNSMTPTSQMKCASECSVDKSGSSIYSHKNDQWSKGKMVAQQKWYRPCFLLNLQSALLSPLPQL